MKYLLCVLSSAFIFCYYNGNAQVKSVGAIGITVREMNRSIKFYTEVLGFKKVSDRMARGREYEQLEGVFGLNMRIVRLQLGDEYIDLVDYLTSGGRSIPEDAHSNDLSFQHIAIVVSNMEQAYAKLQQYGVEQVSTAPQTLPPTIPPAAGVKAFYFHDPDNHNLELIWFPTGKGQPKWHSPGGKLFLGIDHTAIGISNTESSLHFYRDLLGLERKGDSWNFGTEQEHLNNVEHARLHITGLRTAQGPGIEFLEYVQPGPGRKYPPDSRADDVWHWQTLIYVDDVQKIFDVLKTAGYHITVAAPIAMRFGTFDVVAFMVRDPDGHALVLVQQK